MVVRAAASARKASRNGEITPLIAVEAPRESGSGLPLIVIEAVAWRTLSKVTWVFGLCRVTSLMLASNGSVLNTKVPAADATIFTE